MAKQDVHTVTGIFVPSERIFVYSTGIFFYSFPINSEVFKAFFAYLEGTLFGMTFFQFEKGFGKDSNK